jgi:hypothetical protein
MMSFNQLPNDFVVRVDKGCLSIHMQQKQIKRITTKISFFLCRLAIFEFLPIPESISSFLLISLPPLDQAIFL